jgi:hypothetical protein
MSKACSNREHRETPRAYLYTCKKCYREKQQGEHKVPCNCECGHNTYVCTICWKPVKIVNGMYWYV